MVMADLANTPSQRSDEQEQLTTSTSTPELGPRQNGESVVIIVHEPTTTEAQQDEHLPELEELQPPPSYEEVHDPNAPPPSYDSLFGRVREVRKTSRGFVNFIKNLFFFLLGKIGLMIVIGITIIIPICMLVVGSVYFYDCPAENYIPVYLIVGGACGLLKQFLNFRVRSRQAQEAELEVPDSSLTASVQSLINSFLICWFITGCYWVYHVYEPNYDDQFDSNYCSHVLFAFAFWLLTSTYIFVGIVIILLCCISSTALVLTRDR